MNAETLDRIKSYDKQHCYQYDVRLNRQSIDLIESGLSLSYSQNLRVNDFDFSLVTDAETKLKCNEFIRKHEWLGTVSKFNTFYLACFHKEILAGVILIGSPINNSYYFGKDWDNSVYKNTRKECNYRCTDNVNMQDSSKLELLVNRGACISWSPKNLASAFLMWCIKHIVKNFEYKVFSAYSDPHAKELGTIYQACNFYYLGQKFGADKLYRNPNDGSITSARFFNSVSWTKKIVADLGEKWEDNWSNKAILVWKNFPEEMKTKICELSKKIEAELLVCNLKRKHKYVCVVGKNNRETKLLRNRFEEINKIHPYPKTR